MDKDNKIISDMQDRIPGDKERRQDLKKELEVSKGEIEDIKRELSEADKRIISDMQDRLPGDKERRQDVDTFYNKMHK